MAVTGIIGTISDDEENETPIVGPGKTATMVYYLLQDKEIEKREIYTNFHTTFSHYMKMREILEKIKAKEIPSKGKKASIGISELQGILNSMGSRGEEILFSEQVIGQLRKAKINFYWDSQRYKSVVNRVRILTRYLIIPLKTHLDNSPCINPDCEEEHLIYVYSEKPFRVNPIQCIVASEIGKYYDTYEIIDDSMKKESKKK